MKRIKLFLFLIFILHSMVIYSQRNYINSQITTTKSVEVSLDYKYLIRLPENQPSDQHLPLIIFLHGSGERGDSLDLVKVHGPWNFADNHPGFPFMILSPQCKAGETWDPVSLDLLLNEIIRTYPVDTSRIFLTGLSRGGFGVWDWVQYWPHRFAAIAAICGASNYHVLNAEILKDTPVWIFHGALDEVIPVEFSVNLVKKLRSFGAEVKFTVYPDAPHDSWTETYLNEELYNWFLRHSLSKN